MSKQKPEPLIVVGAIIGAHGVRGDVRIKSFTADPQACFDYGPLLDAKGGVLIDAVTIRPGKDHFIVTPKVTRQKEDWDAMKRTLLHVPRSALPPSDEDEYYVSDLIGLSVYGGGDTAIGKVKAVQNYGGDDLLEIDPAGGGKSVLVPFTLLDVPTVDMAARRIVVADFDGWADESKPAPEA